MKFLLIILMMVSSAWADCLKDPSKDYSEQFETDIKLNLLSMDIKLSSKGPEMLMLAAKSSCGAHSCEYAGYVKDSQGCFYRAMTFTGSYELGSEGPTGLKNIVVHEAQPNGKRRSCDWVYNIPGRVMVQITATCRQTTPQ